MKKQSQVNGERIVFSIGDSGTLEVHMQKMNLDKDLTLFTKNNSKWMINLNVNIKL